jgi:preprotein translocase subunit SecE
VARDRQRAKQRKARRAAQNPGPAPSQPRRSDVPGELEHASGEVDEFEAALVSGADGQTVDDNPVDEREAEALDREADAADRDARSADDADELDRDDARSADDADALDRDDARSAEALDRDARDDRDDAGDADVDDFAMRSALADEEDEVDDATLEREATAAGPRREAAVPPGAPTRKGAGRFITFLRASWAELQRVQWPDRRQVAQATGVVIGFVIVAGLYLGLADWVAKQVVNFII